MYDNLEVWYYDETGIQGDSPLRLIWSRRGERGVCYYSGSHIRESVLGAVNPKTGAFESLIMPRVNKEIFQQFLDHFNEVLAGKFVLMVQDNATWHHAKKLKWGTIIPIYLPSYSPNLNAIYLKNIILHRSLMHW